MPKQNIYTVKNNFTSVFIYVNHMKSDLLGHFIACKYIQEEILGKKKSRMIKRNVCIRVTSDLKTSGRTEHFGSHGEVKVILKR